MVLLVDRLQAGRIDVCVNLRGGDIHVSEHFLNASQVGPAGEQLRREGMS